MATAAAAVGVGSMIAGIASNAASNASNASNVASTNQANKDIAQMNNQWSEKMLEKQQQFALNMYEDSKKYNSAPEQVKRLKEAGLNPMLVMGGANAGSAASTSVGGTPSPSQMQAIPNRYDFSGIGQSVQSAVEIYNNMRTQGAQKNLIDEQARNMQIDNRYKALEITKRLANMEADTKNKAAAAKIGSINAKWQDTFNMQAYTTKAQELSNMMETFKGLQIANAIQSKSLNAFDEQFRLQVAEMTSRIALQKAQGQLTSAQAVHELAKQIETKARTAGIKISNSVARRTADELVKQASWTTVQLRNNSSSNNLYQWYGRVHNFVGRVGDKLDKMAGTPTWNDLFN